MIGEYSVKDVICQGCDTRFVWKRIAAIDHDGEGINIPALLTQVAKELPAFKMPTDESRVA